jgi:hypothetical protein
VIGVSAGVAGWLSPVIRPAGFVLAGLVLAVALLRHRRSLLQHPSMQ